MAPAVAGAYFYYQRGVEGKNRKCANADAR